jgi:hypothetical protein
MCDALAPILGAFRVAVPVPDVVFRLRSTFRPFHLTRISTFVKALRATGLPLTSEQPYESHQRWLATSS